MPSVFLTAVGLVPMVRDAEGGIQTEPFLNIARQVLPIIEQLGTAFYLVKQDIGGNIERLATRAKTDPVKYRLLFDIVKNEVGAGEEVSLTSCAKGLLWLKRALEFIVHMLKTLNSDASISLKDAAYGAYSATLQPFHGMLTRGVFTVALNVVPYRERFFSRLGDPDDMDKDIKTLLEQFAPILAEVQKFMADNGLDDPTKV